jgi:hypothetical protein
MQASTGIGGNFQTAGPMDTSTKGLPTVCRLALAVVRHLGASGVFGMSAPVHWR